MDFQGAKNKVHIGEHVYKGKTKTNLLYNVSYFSPDGAELIAYRLSATKRKTAVNFTTSGNAAPCEDLLVLFVLGYYTIRNVMQESAAIKVVLAAGV